MFGAGRVADTYTVAPGPCSPQNIGVNAVLLPVIPYTLVTAIHDTNLHLALILGTAFSGGILLLGLVFKILGGYRVSREHRRGCAGHVLVCGTSLG